MVYNALDFNQFCVVVEPSDHWVALTQNCAKKFVAPASFGISLRFKDSSGPHLEICGFGFWVYNALALSLPVTPASNQCCLGEVEPSDFRMAQSRIKKFVASTHWCTMLSHAFFLSHANSISVMLLWSRHIIGWLPHRAAQRNLCLWLLVSYFFSMS